MRAAACLSPGGSGRLVEQQLQTHWISSTTWVRVQDQAQEQLQDNSWNQSEKLLLMLGSREVPA